MFFCLFYENALVINATKRLMSPYNVYVRFVDIALRSNLAWVNIAAHALGLLRQTGRTKRYKLVRSKEYEV